MLSQMFEFETGESALSNQGLMPLDDGGGFRVVHAEFKSKASYDWDLSRNCGSRPEVEGSPTCYYGKRHERTESLNI